MSEDAVSDEEDGTIDNKVEHTRPQKHRRTWTRSRNVNSIDASLNEDNFKPIHYVNGNGMWETLTGFLGPKSNKNTQTIEWQSKIPNISGRQRRADVIRSPVLSLRGTARSVITYLDCFNQFFDKLMFDSVVEKTNLRINRYLRNLQQYKQHAIESDKYTWLKETDKSEIRTFIGLLYMRGLLGLNHHDVELLFSKHAGPDVFGATMSQQRMKFLLANITFDDPDERVQCWPSDCFAVARKLFEGFKRNCSKILYPSKFLSLHETLYPMRHQIAFRQYNPNKPHWYGLLVKSLNDARVPFTYKAAPYSGKAKDGNGPYYIDHTENLVEEFGKVASLLGQNILTDRLYTPISLANWLLERGITTVGTLNTNRIGIPDAIKQTKDREEFSATCHVDFSGNLYLTSYAVRTKSKGKKNILVLSTMRSLPGGTRDDGYHKPAIIKLYDFTKGGTDIVDQLNDYHTCRSCTFSWDVVALFYMLDTIRVNSKTRS